MCVGEVAQVVCRSFIVVILTTEGLASGNLTKRLNAQGSKVKALGLYGGEAVVVW